MGAYGPHRSGLQSAAIEPGINMEVARADVRYNDRKALRFFPLEGPRDKFTSKDAAEQNILAEAKKLIDSLL